MARLELDEIRALARRAHGDQRDPDGSLHIDHVERVAGTVEGERARAVALLHDVLEDTAETAAGLREAGVGSDVVQAVELLTRPDHEDYGTYIERIVRAEGTTGELARTVKLADARDNLSRSERQGDHARTAKYQSVVDRLTRP
jgi:(p)ppGpp synthase/HD superfamily hydrolase